MELYVDQLMSRPVETIAPTASLHDAAAAMISHDVGALVVVDAEGVAGILTATDFVQLAMEGEPWSDATVAEVMRTEVVTVERSDPAGSVVDAMLEQLIHHVPVVDGSEPVGMVTAFDLAARLGRSLERR